jgi:hypothetical protein
MTWGKREVGFIDVANQLAFYLEDTQLRNKKSKCASYVSKGLGQLPFNFNSVPLAPTEMKVPTSIS